MYTGDTALKIRDPVGLLCSRQCHEEGRKRENMQDFGGVTSWAVSNWKRVSVEGQNKTMFRK